MVQLDNFNADDHASQSFEVMPKGDYVVVIEDSEMKATNAGDGAYIQLTLQVVDGEFKGRKVWDILCIDHPKEKVVTIAKAKLADYCRAVGKPRPSSTQELHDIPLKVRLKVRKDEERGDKNEVLAVLWKETTKPDVSGVIPSSAPTSGGPKFCSDDDIPF